MNNIGHNNPPKFKTRSELISKRVELTKSLVNQMKPKLGFGKRKHLPFQYSDSLEGGFYVVCNSENHIAFWLTTNGRRYHLNSCSLPIEAKVIKEYRELARELKNGVKLGNDPKEALNKIKQEAAKEKTLIQVYDEFIRTRSERWKPATKINFVNRFNVWIKHETAKTNIREVIDKYYTQLNIGSLKISTIDKDMLLKFHKAIPSPFQANRLLEDLRLIFRFSKEKNIIKNNPATFSKKTGEFNPEPKRIDKIDTYTIEQAAKINQICVKNILPWAYNYSDANKPAKQYLISRLGILLSFFTGRRYRSEILSLKWSEVDLKKGWIHLEDSKEGEFSFPLNQKAKAILYLMWRYKKATGHPLNIAPRNIKSKYVFPSLAKGKRPHIYDIRKSFKKICEEASVPLKVIYMLRHSNWTSQENLTIDEKMILGGWKSSDMVKTYSKTTDRQKIAYAAKSNQIFNRMRA
jgi:integrase